MGHFKAIASTSVHFSMVTSRKPLFISLLRNIENVGTKLAIRYMANNISLSGQQCMHVHRKSSQAI